MAKATTKNIINGTWGKLTWDGKEVFEVTSIEAKVTAEREELSFVRSLDKFEKLTGLKGEGTFKVKKVYSRGLKDVVDQWKKGKDPHSKLIIELDDPDALGSETCIIGDVWFKEIMIAQFEQHKFLEREFPFSFAPSSVEFEDTIDVEDETTGQ